MSPRETVRKWLREAIDLDDINRNDDELATGLLDALKAEGFFIGPLKATLAMLGAASSYRSMQEDLRYHWEEMIEEWQRSEGA